MENENDLIGRTTHEIANTNPVEPESRNSGEVNSIPEHLNENGHDHTDAVDSPVSIDYSSFDKIQFATLMKELSQLEDVRKADLTVRDVKPFLDTFRDRERIEAMKNFIADGGSKEDFELKPDAYDLLIDGSIRLIRDKRIKQQREADANRQENLVKKLEVLNKLRELVDGEDTESGFTVFKQIQNEWKSIGAVPPAELKSLWANYHALVDRYYDNRSIYFELKELDRKKNLEAKLELCVRAESLAEVKAIGEAVKELNELHNEFKHIGPVPIDDKEPLWHRFKAASDAVYTRRDAHVKELNQKLSANLEVKRTIINAITELSAFTSDKIKEWNARTKEALDLQKQWEASGPVARAKAKDVNKKFWAAFKTFFNNKGAFFKKLDEERHTNLNKKRELIQQALDLKQSEEWEKTANKIKDMQKAWKEIGPVPEKFREKIYQEFKEVCDYFFDQRRNSFEKSDKEQEENLSRKEQICASLEIMVKSKTVDSDVLKSLIEEYNTIGFVPKRAVHAVRDRFSKLVQQTISSSDLPDEKKGKLNVEINLLSLKNDPDAFRKSQHKEITLRKRISKAENDIAVLKNNLEFFGRSKNAEKYKEEFNSKISVADAEIRQLKAELKMLRAVS
jgi:hypothetical protein